MCTSCTSAFMSAALPPCSNDDCGCAAFENTVGRGFAACLNKRNHVLPVCGRREATIVGLWPSSPGDSPATGPHHFRARPTQRALSGHSACQSVSTPVRGVARPGQKMDAGTLSCSHHHRVQYDTSECRPPASGGHCGAWANFSPQSLCLMRTGKPVGVAVSHCMTWFQTQLILTTCQIRYLSHLWDHCSTEQLQTLIPRGYLEY